MNTADINETFGRAPRQVQGAVAGGGSVHSCGETDPAFKTENTTGEAWQKLNKTLKEPIREKGLECGDLFAERYRVLQLLGEGGMGRVWLMEDTEPGMENHKVAIKVLPRLLARDAESLKLIAREAHTALSLRHDHIVCVRHYGKWHDEPYIVMDYINGISLRDELSKGAMSESATIAMLKPIADALDYAHRSTRNRKAVLHRDIKPENILFQRGDDGAVYPFILDFGISKAVDDLQAAGHGNGAWTTKYRRTPGYAPPEKLFDANCVSTVAQDIFSFAVMAYECLTGRLPFGSAEDGQTLKRMERGEFARLKGDSHFVRAVMRGLSYDQGARPKTCLDFFAAEKVVSAFDDVEFSLKEKRCEWTGQSLRPPVEAVRKGSVEIREGVDYIVLYENNDSVGTAAATIYGQPGKYYAKTARLEFEIVPRDISAAKLVPIPSHVFDGRPKIPDVRVLDEELHLELSAGCDYTVECEENTKAGTARVRIIGKGNYGGMIAGHFQIVPRDISDMEVPEIRDQDYDGGTKHPDVNVIDEALGRKLEQGRDYTVEYGDAVHPGRAWARVTGKGNYAGTVTPIFRILPRDISNATVGELPDLVYDGRPIAEVAVDVNDPTLGHPLIRGQDFEVELQNANGPGEAVVTVCGRGDYKGEVKRRFSIQKGRIRGPRASPVCQYEYDAKEHGLEVKVENAPNGLKTLFSLTQDGDYRADACRFKDVCGPVQVWFRLESDGYMPFEGMGTVEILCRSIKGLALHPITVCHYNGGTPVPAINITDEALGVELKQGGDYCLEYNKSPNAGRRKIRIVGVGNYCDAVESEFVIEPRPIVFCATEPIPGHEFDGTSKRPSVVIRDKELNCVLVPERDYQLRYTDLTNSVLVHITGIGNYCGADVEDMRILPRDISHAKVSLCPRVKYQGDWEEHQEDWLRDLELSVFDEGLKRQLGASDFTAKCVGTEQPARGLVRVEGVGNYRGTLLATFEILPRQLRDEFVFPMHDQEFEGSPVRPSVDIVDSELHTMLSEGVDYTLEYIGNDHAGEAIVIISGCGNYAGSIRRKFTIRGERRLIKPSCVKFHYSAVTGKVKRPSVAVSDPVTGMLLDPQDDFDVRVEYDKPIKGWGRVRIGGRDEVFNPQNGSLKACRYGGNIISRFMIVDDCFERLVSAFEGMPVSIGKPEDGECVVKLIEDYSGKGVTLPDSVGNVIFDVNGHGFSAGGCDVAIIIVHDERSAVEVGMSTESTFTKTPTELAIIDSGPTVASGFFNAQKIVAKEDGTARGTAFTVDSCVKLNGGAHG